MAQTLREMSFPEGNSLLRTDWVAEDRGKV